MERAKQPIPGHHRTVPSDQGRDSGVVRRGLSTSCRGVHPHRHCRRSGRGRARPQPSEHRTSTESQAIPLAASGIAGDVCQVHARIASRRTSSSVRCGACGPRAAGGIGRLACRASLAASAYRLLARRRTDDLAPGRKDARDDLDLSARRRRHREQRVHARRTRQAWRAGRKDHTPVSGRRRRSVPSGIAARRPDRARWVSARIRS